jgi:hypothetical protein
VGRHSSGKLSPFLTGRGGFPVHPIFIRNVHTTAVGVAVFNVYANPGTVKRVQKLFKSRSFAAGLEFSKSLNEIFCKRSCIRWVLFDGFPADRRRTWRRNEKILLNRRGL